MSSKHRQAMAIKQDTYAKPQTCRYFSWKWCCEYFSRIELLCPDWLAPNVITLTGLVVFLSVFVVAILAGYDHQSHVLEPWAAVALLCATAFYQLTDGVDGPHARRLGCSSPLGDYLDNTCDSVFVCLLGATLIMALRVSLGSSLALFCITLAGWSAVSSTWCTMQSGADGGTAILNHIVNCD